MQIIPAIDLKGGKCVRLRQGVDDATTEYSADPAGVAEQWFGQGAERLHLVNLDGAFGRASGHLSILRAIAARHPGQVQYGGGLRTLEGAMEAIDAGAGRVVLGTVAVEQPVLFREMLRACGPERVIVAVDAVEGNVATRGWTLVSSTSALDLVRRLHDEGVREVLYTDVARDGMLSGPDLPALNLLASTGMNVIASGGVSSEEDVRALLALNNPHLSGVIIGKALYEHRVALPALMALSRGRTGPEGKGVR